jgi:hypothetical protein
VRQQGLDNHQGYSPSHNLMYSFLFAKGASTMFTLCAITGCCLWLYIVMETRKMQLQEIVVVGRTETGKGKNIKNRDVGKTKITDFLDCKCIYRIF